MMTIPVASSVPFGIRKYTTWKSIKKEEVLPLTTFLVVLLQSIIFAIYHLVPVQEQRSLISFLELRKVDWRPWAIFSHCLAHVSPLHFGSTVLSLLGHGLVMVSEKDGGKTKFLYVCGAAASSLIFLVFGQKEAPPLIGGSTLTYACYGYLLWKCWMVKKPNDQGLLKKAAFCSAFAFLDNAAALYYGKVDTVKVHLGAAFFGFLASASQYGVQTDPEDEECCGDAVHRKRRALVIRRAFQSCLGTLIFCLLAVLLNNTYEVGSSSKPKCVLKDEGQAVGDQLSQGIPPYGSCFALKLLSKDKYCSAESAQITCNADGVAEPEIWIMEHDGDGKFRVSHNGTFLTPAAEPNWDRAAFAATHPLRWETLRLHCHNDGSYSIMAWNDAYLRFSTERGVLEAGSVLEKFAFVKMPDCGVYSAYTIGFGGFITKPIELVRDIAAEGLSTLRLVFLGTYFVIVEAC